MFRGYVAVLTLLLLVAGSLILPPAPSARAAGEWNATDWPHRARLIVLASKVSGTPTGFPVYVNLANLGNHFWTNVQSDCDDIRVVKSDAATEIPREVVSCNTTARTGEIHFKGDLSSSSNTTFFIYYGNASATNYADNHTYGADNVWDSNFKGVWHLPDGTTLTTDDSTVNALSMTNNSTVVASSTGQVDGAAGFNGSSNYLSRTTAPTTAVTSWTLSAWVKPQSLNQIAMAVYNSNDSGGYGFGVGSGTGTAGGKLQGLFGGVAWLDSGYTFPSTNTWYYISMTRDTTTTRWYVNGSVQATTHANTPGTVAARFTIGNQLDSANSPYRYFSGAVDEVRISSTNRSADWILTEYNNQSSPSTFYTVIDESGGTVITTNVTVTGQANIIGAVSKGSGTFVIDHPLDPLNKLLYHSFVESPDVKNIYDGVATLDEKGETTIELPAYFMALNRDFRYLGTPMGEPMPHLHVSKEVRKRYFGIFGSPVFRIAGGVPGGRVSWQVTGIRHDPFILARPVIPEVEKGPDTLVTRGQYLIPEVYE